MAYYTVQPGDTLSSIAECFGVAPETLAETNGLAADSSDAVLAGLLLNVPGSAGQAGAEGTNGSRSVDELERSVVVLAPEAKKELAATAVETLPTEAKKDVASQAVQTLPTEVKKDIANEAVENLPTEAKKDIATKAMQSLPVSDQMDIAGQFAPSQGEVDRIWQIIVWSFAIVFVLSTAALIAAAFYGPARYEILLTVVTTVAGVLAGFVSGRASSIASSMLSQRGSTGSPGVYREEDRAQNRG